MHLIETLQGRKSKRIPFWFMRQAGRYLPEYREIRKQQKNFLQFCYTPEAAAEVTLQPIHRFDMDAAIIFSDILVIPDALGMKVWFEEGEGPKLEPITKLSDVEKLSSSRIDEHLSPVFKALSMVRKELAPEKALIGFSGSPWTLACYMLHGGGDKSETPFSGIKKQAKEKPELLDAIMELLVPSIIHYLCKKVESGANALQLFDSWCGVLEGDLFTKYVVHPTQKIVSGVRKKHPNIPIIGFPRLSGKHILEYVSKTGLDAVSVDESHPVLWVKEALQPHIVIQGALSNQLLANDKQAALAQTEMLLQHWSEFPFVFNLAHGIVPHTPIENVEAVCATIKNFVRT